MTGHDVLSLALQLIGVFGAVFAAFVFGAIMERWIRAAWMLPFVGAIGHLLHLSADNKDEHVKT